MGSVALARGFSTHRLSHNLLYLKASMFHLGVLLTSCSSGPHAKPSVRPYQSSVAAILSRDLAFRLVSVSHGNGPVNLHQLRL